MLILILFAKIDAQIQSLIGLICHINKSDAGEIPLTKLGDMPRATADPPIVYSSIRAQPINHATLYDEKVNNVRTETHQRKRHGQNEQY